MTAPAGVIDLRDGGDSDEMGLASAFGSWARLRKQPPRARGGGDMASRVAETMAALDVGPAHRQAAPPITTRAADSHRGPARGGARDGGPNDKGCAERRGSRRDDRQGVGGGPRGRLGYRGCTGADAGVPAGTRRDHVGPRARRRGADARRCRAPGGRLAATGQRTVSGAALSHALRQVCRAVGLHDVREGGRARLCCRYAGRPRALRVGRRVRAVPSRRARRLRHHRMGCTPAVVERRRRNVRSVVPRRRPVARRGGGAAAPQGDGPGDDVRDPRTCSSTPAACGTTRGPAGCGKTSAARPAPPTWRARDRRRTRRRSATWDGVRQRILWQLPLTAVPDFKAIAPWYYEWMRHPPWDPWWDWADLARRYARTGAAVLSVSGWYDEAYGPDGATTNFDGPDEGPRRRPVARRARHRALATWRRRYGSDESGRPRVRSRRGASTTTRRCSAGWTATCASWTTEWTASRRCACSSWETIAGARPTAGRFPGRARTHSTWPRPATARVRADCPRAGRTRGSTDERPTSPTRQSPSPIRTPIGAARMITVSSASRADVLTFETPPLADDVEVVGAIAAEVYLAADAPDADLWVKVLDVAPDGTAYNLMAPGSDVIRASYRDRHGAPFAARTGARVPAQTSGAAHREHLQAGAPHSRSRHVVVRAELRAQPPNRRVGDAVGAHAIGPHNDSSRRASPVAAHSSCHPE